MAASPFHSTTHLNGEQPSPAELGQGVLPFEVEIACAERWPPVQPRLGPRPG